ncbi:MAG: glycosyltransferase family 2 protein [Planctomycetes bacterium]|nr:glycosyltransferase family 2 protein [Planctomycetota bacterium]
MTESIPLTESPAAWLEGRIRGPAACRVLELDLASPEGCWRLNRRTFGRFLRRYFTDVSAQEEGDRLRVRAAGPLGDRRRPLFVIGVMRVRNEARWIDRALRSLDPLADAVIVLDNDSTDGTPEICSRFGHVAGIASGIGRPVDSTRDFNRLLDLALMWKPDWVFKLDGDEEVAEGGGAVFREACLRPGLAAITVLQLHLWDDERTIRVDGSYSPHVCWIPRAFNVSRQDPSRLRHLPTSHGANEFCSGIPDGLRGQRILADVALWHYGHMDPARRPLKHAFYASIDPAYAATGLYDHILAPPKRLRARPDRASAIGRWMHGAYVGIRSALLREPWNSWTLRARRAALERMGMGLFPRPNASPAPPARPRD